MNSIQSPHFPVVLWGSGRRMRCPFLLLLYIICVGVARGADTERRDSTAQAPVALGEVSVTALKGGSNTPAAYAEGMSVTTVNASTARILDIRGLREAAEMAPNVWMPRYGSRLTSSVYVRGIGSPRVEGSVVGLCIDNVPLLNKDCFDQDLAEGVASVEVLRGSQNALYGRNTMGGLVNIYTLSPLSFEGVRATLKGGTQGTWAASAGVWRRLTPRLGMALTAGASGFNGPFRNGYDGTPAGRERAAQARWKTAWRSRDGGVLVENVAALSWSRQRGYPYEAVSTGRIAFNDTCLYRRTYLSDGLTVKHRLPCGVTFSAILSGQYLDDDLRLDQDFLPDDYFTLRQMRREWLVTGDFVARGKAASGRYRWLGGLWAMQRRMTMDAPVVFHDTGIASLIEGHRNEINPDYPIRWDQRSFPLLTHMALPTTGCALYHQSSYEALEGLRLTASVRLDFERVAISYHNRAQGSFTTYSDGGREVFSHTDVDIDDYGHLGKGRWQLLPKFTASYGRRSWNFYASVAAGSKAGGYNYQMFSDVLQQRVRGLLGLSELFTVDDIISYKPEHSLTYEAGARGADLFGGKLTASATAFWIESRDMQLTLFPEGTASGRMMANAGRARSRGVELQASWHPLRELTLTGAYGWADARFVRYDDGRQDYRGRQLPFAPRHTLMLNGIWRHALPGSRAELYASALLHAAGPIAWDEGNTLWQPFYATLDLTAGVTRGPLSAEIWGRNVTDAQFSTYYFVSMGNAFRQKAAGVSAGVTVRLNIEL